MGMPDPGQDRKWLVKIGRRESFEVALIDRMTGATWAWSGLVNAVPTAAAIRAQAELIISRLSNARLLSDELGCHVEAA